MRTFTLIFLGAAIANTADPQLPSGLIVVADQLFADGHYQGAADIYNRFAAQGVQNGWFFLNQGNAHLLAGQLPQAILAYRRSERFLPNDRRLRENLAEARRQVLDPPTPSSAFWPDWLPAVARPTQARLALAAFVAGWLFLAIGLVRPHRRWGQAGIIALVLSGVIGGNVTLRESLDSHQPFAVIAADGVILRIGNGESYPAIETNGVPVALNRGAEVRALRQRPNGWLQLELVNGVVGWVPAEQVLLDRPLRMESL